MDERTGSYYAQFAGEIAQRYDSVESEMLALLNRAFARGMRVLDVGAGQPSGEYGQERQIADTGTHAATAGCHYRLLGSSARGAPIPF